ncbi:hypothetical protein GGD46_006408 [Rhizobium lusitanum]|uniref:Uncharacterized protein n=1 Tax=Rhizobium lusitanum TaxID=293958 RepID=A0A7X0MFJ8_9HYPH|nr:hypothetical protein [Rhizobium lusitanum]
MSSGFAVEPQDEDLQLSDFALVSLLSDVLALAERSSEIIDAVI